MLLNCLCPFRRENGGRKGGRILECKILLKCCVQVEWKKKVGREKRTDADMLHVTKLLMYI